MTVKEIVKQYLEQNNKEFLSGEQPRRIAIFETMNNEAERSEVK